MKPFESTLLVVGLCLPVTVAAQQSPAPMHTIAGVVRADGQELLEGAAVRFYPVPDPPQVRLAPWRGLLPAVPDGDPLTTRRSGRFQLRTHSQRGALLIGHPAGDAPVLGALLLDPPSLVQIDCGPLAQVEFAAPVDVHVLAQTGTGVDVPLGHFARTRRIRLPAGSYRFLVAAGDRRLGEVQHQLRRGQRLDLPLPAGSGRRAILPAGSVATVRLVDWPAVVLPRVGARVVVLPAGDLPLRVAISYPVRGGALHDLRWLDGPELSVPPPETTLRTLTVLAADGTPRAGALVVTGELDDGDRSWRPTLRSTGHTDQTGLVEIPGHGSLWLIARAPGLATTCVRIEGLADPLRLQPAVDLRVRVLDRRGDPVPFARIELAPPDHPGLRAVVDTDRLGMYRITEFGAGPLAVRLVDQRFLPTETAAVLRRDQPNQLALRADPGDSIQGQVVVGEIAAANVLVTAQTADGRRRIAITDDRGRFEFSGLREVEWLRMSARLSLGGATYISGILRAQAGDDGVVITLRSEDPMPPGGGRKGKRSPPR